MAEHWVTIREATEILGRTDRTLRRWVAQGKLHIDKSQTPFVVDISDYYQLSETAEPDTPDMSADADTMRTGASGLAVEVDRLSAEVVRLQELLEDARNERDSWKQAHYMALANQQRLLEAPRPRRTVLEWLGFRRRPEEP